MRLKNIKLAGFKSFVDPTTVPFPTNLTAVLGPNGCGKSNIIDAVRWVMGESSAKQLRGESMADVIFNGSTRRDPVGQASIELTFEQCEGCLNGEYKSYAEIALRREVTRDGNSNYYLNGTKCRKRDVTNIFLGTGLGSRSYAIIKQDTISKIVEAKPEELRAHLEEAAGISKYKESRRETVNRIKHTRENLARLTDIRDELGAQLIKLERQASAAEKFKTLKVQERAFKTQMIALQWHDCQHKIDHRQKALSSQTTDLEKQVAEQRQLETTLEKRRAQHTELNEQFQESQAIFYSLGNEITRTEQQLENTRQRLDQLETDLKQVDADYRALHALQEIDVEKEAQLAAELEVLTPSFEALSERTLLAEQTLSEVEALLQDWQEKWDAFTQDAAKVTQAAQVEQTKLQHIEETQRETDKRITKLKDESALLDVTDLAQDIAVLESQVTESEATLAQYQESYASSQHTIVEQREKNQLLEQALSEARTELQKNKGRHASLDALQQAALEIKGKQVNELLQRCALDKNQRLAEVIKVDAGWEHAVEVVLGENLQALCINDINNLLTELNALEEGTLNLVQYRSNEGTLRGLNSQNLAGCVQAPENILAQLAYVLVADDLSAAVALLPELTDKQSVITQDGLWLSKFGLRLARKQVEDDSVLRRQSEIENLQASILELEANIESMQSDFNEGKNVLQEYEQQLQDIQQQINDVTRQQADFLSQLRIKQSNLQQMQLRAEQINADLEQLQDKQQASLAQFEEARSIWDQALEQIETHDGERNALTLAGQQLREKLYNARRDYQEQSDEANDYKVKLESVRSELTVVAQNTKRQQEQLAVLVERKVVLSRNVAESDRPLEDLKEQLAQRLASRIEADNNMQEARARLQAFDAEQITLEKSRSQLEQSVQSVRSALEKQRLESHEFLIRQKTLEEQLAQYEESIADIMENMPEDAVLSTWEAEIERIQIRISRLGAINLAAIEEFDELKERKTHLDAQDADLQEALATLEKAIHKIDIETRQKFKETYDKVNGDFQTLFPKVFGGGAALLELTTNDLLEAGVNVKARPPGKKNSSIHLLSGGEKAMTAVALVFAIFRLNPAPFCMLDEVDAPLDDANVVRFSKLVEEMSKDVQFIFITHNKVTMEMANQLIGVTMHEPGVSRTVSVDVEDAIALAEA